MSNLLKYIHLLPDASFDTVQKHFTARNVVVKEEGPRYMLHPSQHKEHTYEHESPEFQQAMVEAVGTILNKDTNTLCCFGFPKTIEVSAESPPPDSNGKFVVSPYTPGTLIRAYWTPSGWRISTNAVMNAYDSYWGSLKSFGDLVAESLGGVHFAQATALVNQLHQHCSYQFILQQATPPVLHHIGTYDNEQHKYVTQVLPGYEEQPSAKITCNTFADILQLAATKPDEYPNGVIFYPLDGMEVVRYKMLTEAFSERRTLLGNTPNLHLRYLECCAEGTSALLVQEYPHVVPYVTAVNTAMNQAVVEIHEAYIKRFVKREITITEVNYYYRPMVSKLHGLYHQTHQKTTYQTVRNTLLESHPKAILFILKGAKVLL